MVCNSCGREALNEQSNFCIHCGASHNSNIAQHNSISITKNTVQYNYNNDDDMTYKKWLGTLLIPYIPVVGGIVFLVMVIIWAVTKNTNPSKSNWAKAYLLYTVINVVIGFIITIFILAFIGIMMEGLLY